MLLHRAEFVGRENFGTFLNEQGLLAEAVEVGTNRGEFAEQFLQHWVGVTLHCVDTWEQGYDDTDPTSRGDRHEDYLAAHTVRERYYPRINILRMASLSAVKHFRDEQLDFVYVDANHQYRHVAEDLEFWWPKLKPGGVMAGHDIICPPGSDQWQSQIQPAVFALARRVESDVTFVTERDNLPWSYYLIKAKS